MAFNNEIVLAPRADKPHIALIAGYWRVSPMKTGAYWSTHLHRWNLAHTCVNVLNRERSIARMP